MLKRSMDVLFSALGLILLSPLLLLITFLIKATSEGPVFYRGRRAGRYGHPFSIYKFRTMVINADKIGGSSTSDDDPRITRVGKFLRKFKLDELPQLINVLKGEMSLVGPRPEVLQYVEMYTDEEKAILQIRPGMTDWASIWNSDEGAILAGADDPDRAYEILIRPTKLRLQLDYAHYHPLWVDLKILLCTALRILKIDWLPGEVARYGRLQPGAGRDLALHAETK
ncbi:MAG TPA: sugar transferase [Chthonomonadaceae bacterium]|nr:sugar transferase [Chthonomonadaceae bacterium]